MNRDTHTPGPWEPRYESPGSLWAAIVSPARRRDTDSEHRVCELRTSDPEHLGNAALIAAAPELLEALRGLDDWCREHTSPVQPNSPHDLLVKAVNALAKATPSATT